MDILIGILAVLGLLLGIWLVAVWALLALLGGVFLYACWVLGNATEAWNQDMDDMM